MKLLLKGEEMSARQLSRLDLFNISDLKRNTGGVTEIKFYDRLKALEQLSEFENAAGSAQLGLLEALKNSVGDSQ